MRTTRFLSAALIGALALTAFSASAQDDAITLRLWGHSSSTVEDQALSDAVAAFQEANPNITVEILLSPDYSQTLQTAFASGDYPEVFYVGQSDFANYVSAGVMATAGDNIENPDGVYESLRNVYTLNGELYCPAKDFSNLALEYNTDYFEAAGVDVPTADWTWDDMRAAAQSLVDSGTLPEGTVPLALNADIDRWFAFYAQAGGTFYDADGNWVFASEGANYDAAVAALTYYADLNADGLAATATDLGAGWPGEAFGQGTAAMTMEGNWIIGYLQEQYPDLNWGAAELPTGPSGDKATLTFSECYGVAEDNAHPAESWQLVNFLTGEEGAERTAANGFGVLPPREAAAATWLEQIGDNGAAFQAGSAYAVAPVTPPGFQDFRDEMTNGLQQVLDGQISPEEAIDNAIAVADEIAAE